jgi:hypothetical protein
VGSPRSIFARMPRDEFLREAGKHRTQKAFLVSLGFTKRGSLGLAKKLAVESLTVDDVWPERMSYERRFTVAQHALNLLDDTHAYLFGLALADGHLQERDRNRGYLAIELNERDASVLKCLSEALPWKTHLSRRTRVSPFGGGESTTVTLRCHEIDFRRQIVAAGFPAGRKSKTCVPPLCAYNESAFWRGVVDGDGSVGFISSDSTGFISLCSASETMVNAFKLFLTATTGVTPGTTRNARDGVWNITVTRGRSIKLARRLYGGGGLAVERKRLSASLICGDFQ